MVLFVGLGTALAAPPSSLPSRPEPVLVEVMTVPDAYAELRELLLAHHVASLPRGVAPEEQAGLLWLATHDELLVVRERALLVLGMSEPSADAAQHCRALASESSAGKVRAAALRCWSATPEASTPEGVEWLAAALDAPDVRVARATIDELGRSTAGQERLATWLETGAAAPELRARAQAALDAQRR